MEQRKERQRGSIHVHLSDDLRREVEQVRQIVGLERPGAVLATILETHRGKVLDSYLGAIQARLERQERQSSDHATRTGRPTILPGEEGS